MRERARVGRAPRPWGRSVGLILGFGLISTCAFRGNATAIEKGQRLRMSLIKFQVPLGLLAVATSVGYTVFSFI